MMFTKKLFWAALTVMCTLGLNMNGQNANETLRQKYERLVKEADANPADWQKQYDVAQMLIDKNSELHDQDEAGKYYERIYHIAADINPVVPDSVFYESSYVLSLIAMNKRDIQASVLYAEELNRYAALKNDTQNSYPILATTAAAPLLLMEERAAGATDKIVMLRKMMESRNIAGVENTDVMLAVFYDQVMNDYREWVSDKLMEITIDGKPYVLLAMGYWNVEMPFMGWTPEVPDAKSVFIDKDMKVYDDLHGTLQFNFNWDNASQSIVKSPDTTARLITVTPEQRQQYVEAYKKYLSK